MPGIRTPATREWKQMWRCWYLQCNRKLTQDSRASQLRLTDSSLDYMFSTSSAISTVEYKARTMLCYAKFESIWSVLDGSLAIQLALLRCLSSAAELTTFSPDDTPTVTVHVMSRELPLHCPPFHPLSPAASWLDLFLETVKCVVVFVVYKNCTSLLSGLLL
jgi:hypothetical protein